MPKTPDGGWILDDKEVNEIIDYSKKPEEVEKEAEVVIPKAKPKV